MMSNNYVEIPRRRKHPLGAYLRNNWQLYLMLLVPVAFVIIFKYAAYPGLRIAFMDFKPAKGFEGSKWVDWQTFEKVFRDKDLQLEGYVESLEFEYPEVTDDMVEEIIIEDVPQESVEQAIEGIFE